MRQQNTQKKNNRRSIFVIGLLLMLVAVIGFGGYTLSKYVTKKSADANATVAKWGFTATADASKLFGTNYKFDGKKSIVTDETIGVTYTVKSSATDNDAVKNRVAPGTTGSMTFSIQGKAEVLASINLQMTNTKDVVLNYTKGEATGSYAPVKWTLTESVNGQTATTVIENTTLANLAVELNKKFNNQQQEIGTEINVTYTLTWEWAFETGTTNDEKTLNNNLDTLLGMYANSNANTTNEGYTVAANTSTEVGFDLTISVTQLQQAA